MSLGNAAVILKKRLQATTSDVTTLVDGGRQHGAPVFAIDGTIGTASNKGDSERRTSDDHVFSFLRIQWTTPYVSLIRTPGGN